MEKDELSKRELAERRDNALRRALSTPPKLKKESVKSKDVKDKTKRR